MTRPQFQPEQAQAIAREFEAERVDYLFIGKGAAILLGYQNAPVLRSAADIASTRRKRTESGK